MKNRQIVLLEGKKMLSKEEIKGQKFCRFHLIPGY